MKSISAALEAHLAQASTTLATCWKATLVNATVYGFTSHDRDLVIDGVTYLAAAGYTPTAVQSSADLSVDNLDVIGYLDASVITESDLNAGLWDYAAIEIFQVNWADLTMGRLRLRTGTLGEVRIGRQQFTAELRGLMQQLQQIVGQVYSATCRADLGDARCGVNLASFTVTGVITNVTDRRIFADIGSPGGRNEAPHYFTGGKITWTSGLNLGLSMEVKEFAPIGSPSTGNWFTLQLEMPYEVQVGDAYSVHAGCRKRFTEDCQARFDNVVNFRGEPHVPGNDKILEVGGVR